MHRIGNSLRRVSDWVVERTSILPAAHLEEAEPGPAEPEEPTLHVIGELVRAGDRVDLRRHVPENREAFQRWYADEEIAYLLRHDLSPLDSWQSQRYFDSIILPLSARGHCFAIHEHASGRLIGTTALTDMFGADPTGAYFRIVIGEKDSWNHGFGQEATRMMMVQAFEALGLQEVKLEVFRHNPRAFAAYERVGFVKTGEHSEWVGSRQMDLVVDEMTLSAPAYWAEQTARITQPEQIGSISFN